MKLKGVFTININLGLIIQIMLLIITTAFITVYVITVIKNYEQNIGLLALIIFLLLYQWAVYY